MHKSLHIAQSDKVEGIAELGLSTHSSVINLRSPYGAASVYKPTGAADSILLSVFSPRQSNQVRQSLMGSSGTPYFCLSLFLILVSQ